MARASHKERKKDKDPMPLRRCNRCYYVRAGAIGRCPRCGCMEFGIVAMPAATAVRSPDRFDTGWID